MTQILHVLALLTAHRESKSSEASLGSMNPTPSYKARMDWVKRMLAPLLLSPYAVNFCLFQMCIAARVVFLVLCI